MAIYVIDIDGTCANGARRFAAAGPEPLGRGPDYWAWLYKVQSEESLKEDKPVLGMAALVMALVHAHHTVIYVTGREEQYRDLTSWWLKRHNFPTGDRLIMRPNGNIQTNGQFKERSITWFKDTFETFYVPTDVLVIDDDHTGEIEEVCKRQGWSFLKARSGS